MIPLSERLELVKLSYQKIRASKLVFEDVAIEVAEVDSLGTENEDAE